MSKGVAQRLDDLCTRIVSALNERRPVGRIHLDPETFDLFARTKARQLARGGPLLLLGHDVVRDESVSTEGARSAPDHELRDPLEP